MTAREPEFELHTRADGAELTVCVSGELDMATAPELERALDASRAGHEAARVDLSAARFIDSSGLRALLEQRERWRADGKALRLVPPGEQVRRVFALAGLDELFDWVDG